jgi:CRP-like cAMP-binding protein
MVSSKVLQTYSLFGGLLEEQIEAIIPLLVQEKYNTGDIIIAEESPNDKIHFIIEGRVSVIRGETIIYDLAEGNTFGEMEVLDVMPAAATIKAVTDVTTMSISNTSLREVYKNDLKSFSLLIMNLARDLSRRLRIANEINIDGKTHLTYSSSIFMNQ